jgi:hypothetical protein
VGTVNASTDTIFSAYFNDATDIAARYDSWFAGNGSVENETWSALSTSNSSAGKQGLGRLGLLETGASQYPWISTPSFATTGYENIKTTGYENIKISFVWTMELNGTRSGNFWAQWSTDNSHWENIAGTVFNDTMVSPTVITNVLVSSNDNVANKPALWIRWWTDKEITGSGTRDKVSFDNVVIIGTSKYFEKTCMPDLGQHSKNWCWVAAAANSIYWYSQHGYLKLIDAPENAVENDNNYITQMIPVPDGHSVYRLFWEIASDCGHVWDEGVLDNEYFYGLQKFMKDQGVPLIVHEIVNPGLISPPSSVPPASENVIYRSPTLMDYESELENCQDVLLWLNYRYTYPYEDTDHVVTGFAFNDNNWILVSDPWTTGSPDHNNAFENKMYDNLRVLSAPNDPLQVWYAGGPVWVSKIVFISPGAPANYGVDAGISSPFQSGLPGMTLSCTAWVTNTGNVQDTYTLTASDNAIPSWNPTGLPGPITVGVGMTWIGSVDVTIPANTPSGAIDNITFTATGTGVSDSDSCIAQVTEYFIKYCMPDLGQHSKNWCWAAAAANSLYWYSQHGYPELIDDPDNIIENDNTYITQMIATPLPPVDSVYRLLQEIAIECLYPLMPENMENALTIDNTWDKAIFDLQYYLGLQEFIDEAGAPLIVHEIVDNNLVIPPPAPIENRIVYGQPTLENYQKELGRCQDVLLWLNYKHMEEYPYEETDHVVTGVGFSYDNQWLIVSDPWTPGAPDHSNDLTHTLTPYDDLQVISVDPLWVLYNGMPVQVSKMVYISPENVPENLWTGTVTITLDNLYSVTVNLNGDFSTGSNLIAKFYTYGGVYQDNTLVDNENIPGHVTLNKHVSRPGKNAIQRVDLVVTDSGGTALGTIKTWATSRPILVIRIGQINGQWPFANEATRTIYVTELGSINGLWPFSPETYP